MSIFDNMSVTDAIEYCHEHKHEFERDACSNGEFAEDAINQYDCLLSLLESGHVLPANIPDYGMDFEDEDITIPATTTIPEQDVAKLCSILEDWKLLNESNNDAMYSNPAPVGYMEFVHRFLAEHYGNVAVEQKGWGGSE